MRTKLTLLLMLVWMGSVFAQGTVQSYQMYETTPMKPKRGHEKFFEEAVKVHNAKYHASGPHKASLSAITEGAGSDGWYFWVMGPLMYSNLDNQPNSNNVEHDNDWAATVDPHVEEYGEVNLWKLQDSVSVTPANYNPDRLDVWVIDLKPGMRTRFLGLMKKWKGLWDANNYPYAMRVFLNDLWNANGKDATIVYSFSKYADFDLDIKWMNDYEKKYGAGSWEKFWKEWNECVNSTSEHLRKIIK